MKHPAYNEYQKAIEEYNKRSNKNFLILLPHLILIIALIIFGLFLLSGIDKPPVRNSDGIYEKPFAAVIFIPYLIISGIYITAFIVIAVIFSMRCPSCRKFFPRQKLELYDTMENSYTDSDGVVRVSSKRIYITECRFCKKVIWIVR